MLESKLHAYLGYRLSFNMLPSFNGLLKKGLKELVDLVTPEDTTMSTGRRQTDLFRVKVGNTVNIVKVLFWVVVSIAISVGLGQL